MFKYECSKYLKVVWALDVNDGIIGFLFLDRELMLLVLLLMLFISKLIRL